MSAHVTTAVAHGAACPCGQALPWHLFTCGLGAHLCSGCNRFYTQEAGVVSYRPRTRSPLERMLDSVAMPATARVMTRKG